MCRRCGEPDRRPNAEGRRRLTARLLSGQGVESQGGNGKITVCMWCYCLLGDEAGHLYLTDPRDGSPIVLEVAKLERDRLDGNGSPYRLDNLVPACGPCNRARVYDTLEIPEGCYFGPEAIELVRAARTARLAAYAADLEALEATEATA